VKKERRFVRRTEIPTVPALGLLNRGWALLSRRAELALFCFKWAHDVDEASQFRSGRDGEARKRGCSRPLERGTNAVPVCSLDRPGRQRAINTEVCMFSSTVRGVRLTLGKRKA